MAAFFTGAGTTSVFMGDESDLVSKSQRKRDALALQSLGDDLAQLSAAELDKVALPDDLREAVVSARSLTKGAYRRQIRYLGRLLREIDAGEVRAAVDGLRVASNESKGRLRRLERWRERLVEEGDDAVRELLDTYPHTDRQQLRQLVRNARRERAENRAPHSYRQLFRFLRDL
jgi:ribosome-associated protein